VLRERDQVVGTRDVVSLIPERALENSSRPEWKGI